MPVPSTETLRGMGNVLMDIAAEIASDYPVQANSLRNMATELLATGP